MSTTRLLFLARTLRTLAAARLIGLASGHATAAPPGDDFANPIQVSGERWLQAISATNATAEPGEKSHYSVTVDLSNTPNVVAVPPRSIWLNWKAPRSGVGQILFSRKSPLTSALARDEVPPRLVIYKYTASLSSLRRVTGTLFGASPQQLTRFQVAGGENYRFVLSGTVAWDGDYMAAFTLDDTNAPPNDLFAQATTLPAVSPIAVFDLEWSTAQPDEPGFGETEYLIPGGFGPFGGGSPFIATQTRGGASQWFRWVAPAAGGYSITVAAPGATPQLGIWRKNGPENPSPGSLSDVKRVQNGGIDVTAYYFRPCDQCGQQVSFSQSSWHSETATAAIHAQVDEEFWLQVDRFTPYPFGEVFPEIDPWNLTGQTSLTNCNLGVLSISRTAANDSFAAALPFSGGQADTTGNAGATFEPGEPVPAGIPESWGSFWWTWTVPSTGLFLIGTPYSEVFRGNTLTELALLNANAVISNRFFGTFRATAGEKLRIRSFVAPSGAHTINSPLPNIIGAAANDDFQRATILPADGERALRLPPAALTIEPGEPVDSALSNPGTSWFRIPADRHMKLLIPWEFAPPTNSVNVKRQYLRAFEGESLDSLTELSPSSSAVYGVIYSLAADRDHYLQLQRSATYWEYPVESYVAISPRNDQFAGRLPISGELTYMSDDVYTPLLTSETDEPNHAGKPAHRSAWFEWTAPASGPFICDFNGPIGSRLAFYRGSEVQKLKPVASAIFEDAAIPSRLRFDAIKGEKLSMAFDTESSFGTAWFRAALDHDTLATAKVFSTFATSVQGTPASTEPEERLLIPDSPYGVVWHHWVAPAASRYALEIMLTGVRPRAGLILPGISIFSGPDHNHLSPVHTEALTQFTGRKLVSFHAEAGQVCYFGVVPQSNEPLRYDLGLLGTVPTETSVRLQSDRDPLVPVGFSTSSRFVHRLERSANLTAWELSEWLDPLNPLGFTPAKHLYPTGNTFLRIVSPQ